MKAERYRCPKCDLAIPANEVDVVKSVWPQWQEKNSSGVGSVRVSIRPGQIHCQNPSHDRPIVMRRETVDA